MQGGAFWFQPETHMPNTSHIRRGFSMIELVMVIVIVGVIVSIAAPRFAEGGSGRRLNAARNAILDDIQIIKLRARATGKAHTIKFYPNSDMYAAFEGLDINKSAIVLARTLSESPFNVDLSNTNLDTDQAVVVSPMGDLEKSFSVGILDSGVEKRVEIHGIGFSRESVTETDSQLEIETGILDIEIGDGGIKLNLGL